MQNKTKSWDAASKEVELSIHIKKGQVCFIDRIVITFTTKDPEETISLPTCQHNNS